MKDNKITVGGAFLVKDADVEDIFIPEEFNEEQRMIAQTCDDFLEAEIFPNLKKLDAMEEGLMPSLIKKAGKLGLLGICVPEEYGGFAQSFLTTMRANESIGAAYSYSVAFMAHTGIGTLPILYYGNEEQIQKYVTRLASGELIGCYCLTEPGAGSDANSGKSKAVLSEDGKHYILEGQKMWITNGGFADIQTVFAKIDNDKALSAFIVEKNMPGVVLNTEEKKMGIKGSSTVQIFYNDVKVPVKNLLGKRGEGFRIALNILHIGRIKLAVNVLGAAKRTITQSVNYANERKQFGMQIANFGAIKYKLAEQVIRTFTTESAVYRASKDIDDAITKLKEEGSSIGQANIEGCARFSVECALLKVLGSEALNYVVDEGVQIHGGMGYSAEMPAERAYRDSRINRIFEGTNEINRLLTVEQSIKIARKGGYDLANAAKQIIDELQNVTFQDYSGESYFNEKKAYITNFKKAVLMVIGTSLEKFDRKFFFEQEIMCNISDMMMPLYAAESTMLRVQKLDALKGEENTGIYKDILDVFIYDSADKINKAGTDAINSYAEGAQQQTFLNGLKHFTNVAEVNIKEARRRIADKLIDDNKYSF